MAGKVQELRLLHGQNSDNSAREISTLWEFWDSLRQPWVQEQIETRNYLFATDTTGTGVDLLDWKNKTTLPKLCQIRDNLHANYISALFPNDNWVRWEGDSVADETAKKKAAIEGYISTKVRQSDFKDIMSALVYDYIDTGNTFSTNNYVRERSFDPATGEEIAGYTGPQVSRIDPMDIVFNPISPTFHEAPKIIRKIMGIGEIAKLAQTDPDWEIALKRSNVVRRLSSNYTRTDWNKAVGYQIDGFGNLRDYYGSSYAEILIFEGDIFDKETETLKENTQIVTMDRAITVKTGQIPHPLGKRRINHAGWRKRPNNLYAMGPLSNLIGLQYRLDHLENLKADAMDLMVHPPLVIKGDVDPFVWHPNLQIRITEDGDVQELGMNLGGITTANTEIELIERRMEEYAGAPKQAMGIRTPGEKTAFEVQSLDNAAGRIFTEKTELFEVAIVEKELNSMLATAIKEGDVEETVRVFDTELSVNTFLDVTTNDLSASGTIRPIGARHFGQQAQLLQNLAGTLNGPLGELMLPHVSGKQLAKLVADSLQLDRFGLVRPFIQLIEQQEAQELGNVLSEEGEIDAATPTEPDLV